jgi:predicted neutral ceramidase superfamily lipid hydrolase
LSDFNRFIPPTADLGDQRDDAFGSLGLKVGLIFASPFVIGFSVVLLQGVYRHSVQSASLSLFQLPIIAAISLTGRWWALRGLNREKERFLAASLLQGFLFMSTYMGSGILVYVYLTRRAPVMPSFFFAIMIIGTGVATLWALALGACVKWRIRKAQNGSI